MISNEEIEQVIQKLPSLSTVAMEVVRMIDSEGCDLATLEKKISQDQCLSARILRIANSPFYGFSGEITSTKEACVILGMYTIRNVAITAAVYMFFSPQTQKETIDYTALWKHAFYVGTAAKVLARHHGYEQNLAFTAGLLHDIGKLVLEVCFPTEFSKVRQYCNIENCSTWEAEATVFGMDHTMVGAKLAAHWNFPSPIRAAIERHHTPDQREHSPVVDLVHIADILSTIAEGKGDNQLLLSHMSPGAAQRIGMDIGKCEAIFAEIEHLNASIAFD
ncbi:MAG: HDOD domain-containing protein [Gammaproteobacteria bacterium]